MSTTESKKTTAKKESEPTKVIRFVYCGPSFPDGSLIHCTIFKGAVSADVNEKIKSIETIKKMIVPVEQLATVQQALKDPASLESAFYTEIAEAIRESRKKRGEG